MNVRSESRPRLSLNKRLEKSQKNDPISNGVEVVSHDPQIGGLQLREVEEGTSFLH